MKLFHALVLSTLLISPVAGAATLFPVPFGPTPDSPIDPMPPFPIPVPPGGGGVLSL